MSKFPVSANVFDILYQQSIITYFAKVFNVRSIRNHHMQVLCLRNWRLFQDMSTEVKSECLDILCDVLHRFGGLMTADHEKLMNALLVQLNLQRAGLRKRAIQCLGKYTHPLLASKAGKRYVYMLHRYVLQLWNNVGEEDMFVFGNLTIVSSMRYQMLSDIILLYSYIGCQYVRRSTCKGNNQCRSDSKK